MHQVAHHLLPDYDMPYVHHLEVIRLTRQGFDLDSEYMRHVLALPRETLLEDLLSLMQMVPPGPDGEELEALYNGKEGDAYRGHVGECAFCFVSHALFFAGELGATELLGKVLNILSQIPAEMVLYAQDDLWQAFYQIGRKKPQLLLNFVSYESDDDFRGPVVEALGQLALQEPMWRDEIVKGLQEALKTILDRKDAMQFHPDSCFNGDRLTATTIVTVLTQLGIVDAVPLISEVLSREMVDPAVCGNLKEIEKQILRPASRFWKREIRDIVQLYRSISNAGTDAPFSQEESSILNVRSGRPERAYRKPGKRRTVKKVQARTGPKVGRNDPCPCGSGKKYKKCHGR